MQIAAAPTTSFLHRQPMTPLPLGISQQPHHHQQHHQHCSQIHQQKQETLTPRRTHNLLPHFPPSQPPQRLTAQSAATPPTFSPIANPTPTTTPTETIAQAASSSAAAVVQDITPFNPSSQVAVWTSDRPLRRLPATSVDDPVALEDAARHLPGYHPHQPPQHRHHLVRAACDDNKDNKGSHRSGGNGYRGDSERGAEGDPLTERKDPTCWAVLAADGSAVDFRAAERALLCLLTLPDLDVKLERAASAEGGETAQAAAHCLNRAVEAAVARAYGTEGDDGSPHAAACHSFLQRLLYRLNRLNHFWYDDLSHYENERSPFLARLRDSVEAAWQSWEATRRGGLDGQKVFKGLSVRQLVEEVRSRAAGDVDPPPGPSATYMRQEMSLGGYRHLLAVGALDGLVEASRQSRVCAGAPNEIATTVFRVLMEEYGSGKLSRKHSTFYHSMLAGLGLDTRPEAYFDLVPWQCLASANHNFLLTERRRHYLRYLGGLTYFEVNGPSVYRTYCTAAQRLGLPPSAWGYWELHVREDERHGRQMVEEVAVPLITRYGSENGWEVLWGYAQEVAMGARAGEALVADIRAAELEEVGSAGRKAYTAAAENFS